jgi:hypothetical protein
MQREIDSKIINDAYINLEYYNASNMKAAILFICTIYMRR